MSVSPKESCLFGGERIKISFPVQAALNPDAEYYVVFEGVLQRHVTKATLANEKTVRAVIPEHSTAETINLVVLCQNQKQDRQVLVTDTFTYHEDSSHLLARHLVESVDNAHALDNITQIRGNGFDLSSEDLTTLDSRLMKVFLEMKLPRDWNLLGEDYNLPDIPPRETLFHLAARLGLQQVTEFLMYQPGSLDALSLQNSQSLLPLDIAKERGDEKLINTLLGKNCYTTGGPPWLEKWKKPQPPTMVQRHEYGMATITNDTTQSKRTLDDDIQLLHNMSKVVYDDNRGTGEEQPPPVPPHSSATRQRHSMAEDYYRQKLYYSDHYSAQQRHSLAEQHAAPRMYDIPMETPQGYAERKALPAPSHRHRPTPARPRLPSPDRTSSKSHSASSYDDSETPPPLPKRPSSDRLVDTTMPNLETQSQGMALDRGRERRPLLNMDTLTFEEHMSSLDTPPVLTPHNQQSRDPRSVDRLEKQKLRQSSNQIRDRLSSSDCKKSDWSDSENQEHNRDASRVAPPRARRTEERIPSPDDTKKARYTGYHEEQSISTPGYGRRRHRSGHEAPTQFASSEKAPDAQRIKWPPSVEDIHKKKSQSSSEYRPISLIRPRVYSLDNQVSPSKVSLPYQHARSSSMEDHQNQLLRSSNEEVLIEPPYECPIPCESPIQKTYCRPELQIRLAQAQRQKDYARKIQSVVSKSSVQRQSKPPKPPKPDPSLSRPHPTGLPPKPARSPVSHGRSASMEGMYMYRSESHEEERLMSSDGLAQRVRYKSEEPTRLKTLSDGQAPAPDDEPSEARSAREPYHVGLGDSEGSEDESKSGRRYKRNTFGAKPGSHYRKIYQKHQAGSHSSGRSREGESASSGRMESTTSMGLSEPATPASSHYGDVFSPSTDPYNENVLEDSLRRLQEINDGIYKLREENSQGEQKSSRRNSLQRHSTSCPSLAEKLLTATKIVPIEDSEHHRSMQELIPDSLAGGSLTSRPAIIVDDVSHSVQGGETSMGGNGESEMLTIEQMKKQQRRSSWCPEEERKKEEKTEKQILLGVSGRSQSLSSLEGEADDSEPEADSDADCSYARQGGESYGEGEDLQYMDVQNSEDDDEDEDTASRGMRRRPEIRISGPDGDTKLQGSDSSPGVSPYSKAGQSEALVLPTNLAKASSTPSIISGEEETVEDKKRSGSIPTSNGSPAHLCGEGVVITTGRPRDGRREVLDDTDLPDTRLLARRELLLSDPTTTIEDAEQRKDERKKKQSIFSKMGSYRQKKISKERPASASHQFVSISISNSTACDLCGKPMANKSCLQCETQQGVKVPGANLKSSQSFKESSRSLSAGAATNKHSGQVSQSANSLGKAASSKALSEEKEEQQGLVPESSNITETLSVSMESIEEAESNIAQITEVELERDLHISSNEPEAWSVTVDKKTLKKMTAKDIKRQDTIWEFIQTEKSHCRTLRIMQKIFYQGLLQECELSQEMVDRIFPRLYDLLDIHLTFLQRLLEKQRCHADKSISSIGDLFKEQFEGVLGDRMKQAYGEFCSRHKESVQLYKDILKSDKKLQIFAKKCSRNSLCKRLDIPACILLVTQRPTKYPLLLESLVKATKEYEERENLTRSLLGIREILAYIDKQIDEHEKYQKLIEIYNKVDARSSAVFNQKKFKKSDLLSNNRKLLHEGIIKFMNARGKTSDVLAVILSDVMFFLVENNQKYTFFSQDNKSSVIALSKLLVREKGDTKDSKGIYLICQSKTEPEMYELVCKSADERKYWIQTIKAAIGYCLEQEAGSAQNQEDKKLLEARTARLRQLIDNLAHVDQSIRNSLDNKNKLLVEMVDLFCKEDSADGKLRSVYKDEEGKDLQAAEIFLQTALLQGEKLMALLQTSAALSSNGQSTNLSRSVSSVGEHSTGTTTPPLPKRADTFSGFESKENHRASAKKRFPTTGGTSASEMRENNDARNNNSTATLEEADSGLGLDTKEKINRRMSTSFLQNLLNRQHLEKDDSEGSNRSDKSSDRGSALDLSNLSPAISISNLAVSREQCACLAQLMQSVHGLAAIASQQSTEVESFKAQLAEANAKISRLYSEPERYLASDKKNTYHHDKQLEELRNLQEQINQDRSVFEKEKSQQNLEIHQERQEIKAERENISKQKSELKAQRDELQRQREALQKQMDLFEQQKSQFNKTVAQVGDIVSSRTPPSQRERSESPASSGSSLERTHKRAGSTDLHSSREGSPFEPMAVGQSNSLKEPLNKAKPWSSSVVVAAGAANNSNAKNQLPMHLKSSSNDIKMGSVVQQLPLKLAGKTAAKGAATGTSGVKQVLPFKLSASVSPQAVTSSTVVPASKGAAVSSCASPPLGPRASQNSSGDTPKLTHTRSHPTLPTATVAKARTVSHHNSVSNVLPLKLAEAKSGQRPQSASSAGRTPQGSHHPDQKDSKSGKKEPEIIYF